jgi:hypothetical protein
MEKEGEFEKVLLLDASNIGFERERLQKEDQDLNLRVHLLSSKQLTSFDRKRLDSMKGIVKSLQLLNGRQERYFDALRELTSTPALTQW